jgi:hypothetical protein
MITGTDFTQVTGVQFGEANAPSVNAVSNTQITATSPLGSGTVDVIVTTRAGTSDPAVEDHFTYGPTVTALSPRTGDVGGGDRVAITGSGFTGATAVQFGRTPADALNVSSDTQIIVITPPGSPGFVPVTVITPDGTSPVTRVTTFRYFTLRAGPGPVAAERPAAGPQERAQATRRRRPAADPQEQAPADKPAAPARRRKKPS